MNWFYFFISSFITALVFTILTYFLMAKSRDILKPFMDSKSGFIQVLTLLGMLTSIILMIVFMNVGISFSLHLAVFYLVKNYLFGYIFTLLVFAGIVFYLEKMMQFIKIVIKESNKPISPIQFMYGQEEWMKDLLERNKKDLNLVASVYAVAVIILGLFLMIFPILRILLVKIA